ncbi:MAG: hypothetical protein KAJ78_06975, partial [Acidobacteria bacterium]|nr:hypothetical protein [Acidobacteriota bacterium]
FARSSPRWSLRDLHGFAVIALWAMRDVPTYRKYTFAYSSCEIVKSHGVLDLSRRPLVKRSG